MDCSSHSAFDILNTLGDVVKDNLSDRNNCIEMKLFPGLKITSRYIPLEQSKSNLRNIASNSVWNLSVYFTDNFKRKVRKHDN